MKKDILFIVSNMESGGFQKSLISLLQCFDFEVYNVDLLIFSPVGIFMNKIPKQVNILNFKFSKSFFASFPKSLNDLVEEKEFILAFKRTVHFAISRLDKSAAAIYMSRQIPKLYKEYDVAIDYNGQHILYYMEEQITAKKKLTYFHSDYEKWDYYKKADKKYYPKIDYIITISKTCKESLDKNFPECKEKTRVIHNISSSKEIRALANEECSIEFDESYINISIVGRPYNVKGYDFAIESCKKLKEKGYKVRFYSIGISEQISKYKNMVKKMNIQDEFIFLGETDNPYIYMKKCDIYIQPSRFEGKSVAIDEAKILCKPIIITNFTTAKDHIENGINGLIVDMNSYALYEGIKMLIDDKNLKQKFINNLVTSEFGNEDEVNKLYKLMN